MRILTVSDLHVDYAENLAWVLQLGNAHEEDYSADVLIVAGDVCDDMTLLEQVLSFLLNTFGEVCFVPGNHELWVGQGNQVQESPDTDIECSLQKFQAVKNLCARIGIHTEPLHLEGLSIVPLYSWYDFSFGEPDNYLRRAWRDFRACRWPAHLQNAELISDYFLELNEPRLELTNDIVISFSHFLPSLDVMPDTIPEKRRKVYPVLGSNRLGKQVARLRPDIHIYGHSHVNQNKTIAGINYVNNAFAYPSEGRIARKALHCVHDSEGDFHSSGLGNRMAENN